MLDVSIYLETTVKGPNRSNGMYGYVVEFDSGSRTVTRSAFANVGDITANQLMLMGLINSIKILTKPCSIVAYMDSTYILNTINKNRIKNWSLQEWKNASGKTIKNRSLWQMIDKHLETHKVLVIDTKQHTYTEYLLGEIEKRNKKWR